MTSRRWSRGSRGRRKLAVGARATFEPLEPRWLLDAAPAAETLPLFDGSAGLLVENRGQWADESLRFAFQQQGANVLFRSAGLAFELCQPDTPPEHVAVVFEQAAAVEPVGRDRAPGVLNYYVGDQARWQTDVPAYETVAYAGLYDGIDLHVQALGEGLKYEFHVAPGSDYRQIQITYAGAEELWIDQAGALHVATAGGEMIDGAPLIYQEVGGGRVAVAGQFELIDDDTCAFDVTGGFDAAQELIIDPDLVWSSYLGGSSQDYGSAIAVDEDANAIVAGYTSSMDFAGADGAHGGGFNDAFVAKLDPAGALVWATYLGGNGDDRGMGVAVDPSDVAAADAPPGTVAPGSVLLSGRTSSTHFAGTTNLYQGGLNDAFVAKLDHEGSLLWATYLGGSGDDRGAGIAVDSTGALPDGMDPPADGWGSALVTGYTSSTHFTGQNNAYRGLGDAFVAKLDSAGSVLWATHLGSGGTDRGYAIAADASAVDLADPDRPLDGLASAIVTGQTGPQFFPGANNPTHGGDDAFVAKITPDGSQVWATHLGGAGGEAGFGLAVNAAGSALVTGETGSIHFAGAVNDYHGGDADAFAAKVSSAGELFWASYVGGVGNDRGYAVAMDGLGEALLAGETDSPAFAGGDGDVHADLDAFVAKVGAGGAMRWADRLGGTGNDAACGIAVSLPGTALVTGVARSTDLPAAINDHQGGTADAFAARVFDFAGDVPPVVSLTGPSADVVVGRGGTVVIAWDDGDPTGATQIALAFDPDNNASPWSNDNHAWITPDAAASPFGFVDQYNWDTTFAEPGTYTIWRRAARAGEPATYVRAAGRVTVQGVGVLPPAVFVDLDGTPVADGQVDPIDFGPTAVGGPGETRTFTIRNGGDEPLTLGDVEIPAGFTLLDPLPAELAGGQAATFTVRLDGDTVGAYAGEVTFQTSDPARDPFNFPVTGGVWVPPTAEDDTAGVAEDSADNVLDVLANDTALPDAQQTLTIVDVEAGGSGQVTIVGGGTALEYTPAADFQGTDTFTYTIVDDDGLTDTATVTVTVTNEPDAPVAADDTADLSAESVPQTIDVLANDTYAPDPPEQLAVTAVTDAAHGQVVLAPGGDAVIYTPDDDYFGTDTFTYTITDEDALTDTATVTVGVGRQEAIQAGQKITFADANGEKVTVRLTGDGQGTLRFRHHGLSDLCRVELHDTSVRSSLTIKTRGRHSATTVEDVVITNSMRTFVAATTTLLGDLTVHGLMRKLTLADVDADHVIALDTLGLADPQRDRVTIVLGRVTDTTLETNGLAIRSLRAIDWTDSNPLVSPDRIVAPSIGRLKITGRRRDATPGDFAASLRLTGAGEPRRTLGSARIAGAIAGGTWDILGAVGTITVSQAVDGWTLHSADDALASVSTLRLGRVGENVDVKVDGPVRVVRAIEWAGGTITADAIRSLKTTGKRRDGVPGDFGADLTLNGLPGSNAPTLRSARIAGDLLGSLWKVFGDVRSIYVAGTADGSTIRAAGSMRSLTLGAANGSDFLVGVDADQAVRHVAGGADFLDPLAEIRAIKVRGWRLATRDDPTRFLTDSNFSAPGLGTVTLRNAGGGDVYGLYVLTDPDGDPDIRKVIYRDTLPEADNWARRPARGDELPVVGSLQLTAL